MLKIELRTRWYNVTFFDWKFRIHWYLFPLYLFQVDAKSNSSRSDSICNWNFGDFSLLRQEMIQNKPKSIASKLKIGIQVSVGIFSVNFYDDSRVFFVYLDSFQVLRI